MNKKSKKNIHPKKKKSVSLKKLSPNKVHLFKSFPNQQSQLMIPELFQIPLNNSIDKQKSESSFIFRGNSGTYQDNSWSFSPQDTAYLVNPLNYHLTSIYPNYDRFFWTGKKFIDSKNQVLSNVPQWLTDLLPEDNLDIFLKIPTKNDWTQIKIRLFDIVSHNEILESRLKRLEFMLENCHLQWKITKIPEVNVDNLECPIKIFETQKVLNMHQAYSEYKESLMKGSLYLLLRPPQSLYIKGKSRHLLIWKPETKIKTEVHK